MGGMSSRAGVGDLHTHSRMSDGTDDPAELVRAAHQAGLATIALTDHDTTAGWDAAAAAAAEVGIRFIPGMEMSTRRDRRSVHLLAYLFDRDNPELLAELERTRSARSTRAREIVARIAKDYDFGWEDVAKFTADEATVGRPHIADALVHRGLASDRGGAFQTLLHPQSPYYVPLYSPSPLDAVRLVRGAGGVPVLAHPASRGAAAALDDDYLGELVGAGLFGLELSHRENQPAELERLRAIVKRFHLIATGASDYHGTGKPNLLGENTTPDAVTDLIIQEARRGSK